MLRKIMAGTAAALLGVGGGLAAGQARAAAPSGSMWCVMFGRGGDTAAGNVVEYNWSRAQCPAGTYPVSNPAPTLTDGGSIAFFSTVDGVTSEYQCTVGMSSATPPFTPTLSCK